MPIAFWNGHTNDDDTKKVLARRASQIKAMITMKNSEMNGAVASLREAQHMLVSLGGFDTTATEVWPPQLPNKPLVIPKALMEQTSASSNGTRPVDAEKRPVLEGVAAG